MVKYMLNVHIIW